MYRASVLAAVLTCVSAQSNALSIIMPECTTAHGTEYYNIGEMSGNLRLTTAFDVNGVDRHVVLAHCPSMTQVVVRHDDNSGEALSRVKNEITRMIASAESYTFGDVAERFSYGSLSSEMTGLVDDGCICAEGN